MVSSQGFGKELTYFDLIVIGLPGIFDALNVNAVRGNSRFIPRTLVSCGFTAREPATMPSPVSTRAWPRDPALDPRSGISFLAWKFRGLRPLTTIGAVVDSVRTTFVPFVSVPTTFRCSTKCCCSSFRLPLLAVALYLEKSGLSVYRRGFNRLEQKMGPSCSPVCHLHPELQTPPPDRVHGVLAVGLLPVVRERNQGQWWRFLVGRLW